jgi:hypothetical protein
MARVLNQNKSKCRGCGKRFVDAHNLEKHVAVKHPEEASYALMIPVMFSVHLPSEDE